MLLAQATLGMLVVNMLMAGYVEVTVMCLGWAQVKNRTTRNERNLKAEKMRRKTKGQMSLC